MRAILAAACILHSSGADPGALLPDFSDATPQPQLRILLLTPHPERIPLLIDHYRGLPWRMLMAVAQERREECAALCGGECECVDLPSQCDSSSIYERTGRPVSGHHHNLLIAPHADGSSDLLFTHSDMWMSRRMHEFVAQRRTHILLPGAQLPESCHTPGTAAFSGNTWDKWPQWGPRCEAAMLENGNSTTARILRGANVCCHGWADLLYLPAASQRLFAEMATSQFLAATAPHEGVIATIVNALTQQGLFSATGIGCAGSCCDVVGYGEISNTTLCAHTVDLRDAGGWRSVALL